MQVSPEDSPSTWKYSLGSRSRRGGGPLGPWRSSNVAGFLDKPPPPASSTNQHSIASGPAETTVARPGGRGSGDQAAPGCAATCPPLQARHGTTSLSFPACPSLNKEKWGPLTQCHSHKQGQRLHGAAISPTESLLPFTFIFPPRRGAELESPRSGQVRA